MLSISLKFSENALKNLNEALNVVNPSKLERDGVVQRFEIAYEQTWKAARKILKENEIQANTPKEVFRELVPRQLSFFLLMRRNSSR